jgi:RHS repeat-associated protein
LLYLYLFLAKDGNSQADAITSTPFLSFTFQIDPAGIVTKTAEANLSGSAGTQTYGYDTRYRLSQDNASATKVSDNWQYDAATQILTTTYKGTGITIVTPVTTTRSYDAANEIQKLIEKTGTGGGTTTKSLSYTFDNDGNRTERKDSIAGTTTDYSYDQANRLKLISGATNAAYAYNGDGLRMDKAANFTGYVYSWDVGVQAGLPLVLQDNVGSYIYGPGGMLVEEVMPGSPDAPYYYHTDQLGSVRDLTNGSGTIVDTYTYDAYGKTLTTTGSVYNPFGYTGEYTDAETGFLYLRARYYDPESQQFLTVDPALAWTQQAYAYALGSPTNATDPSGLSVHLDFGHAQALVTTLRAEAADLEGSLVTWHLLGGGLLVIGAGHAVYEGFQNVEEEEASSAFGGLELIGTGAGLALFGAEMSFDAKAFWLDQIIKQISTLADAIDKLLALPCTNGGITITYHESGGIFNSGDYWTVGNGHSGVKFSGDFWIRDYLERYAPNIGPDISPEQAAYDEEGALNALQLAEQNNFDKMMANGVP